MGGWVGGWCGWVGGGSSTFLASRLRGGRGCGRHSCSRVRGCGNGISIGVVCGLHGRYVAPVDQTLVARCLLRTGQRVTVVQLEAE